MKHKLIHVVMGTTGRYEDRTEWPVAAFLSKEKAEELEGKAHQRACEIYANHAEMYGHTFGMVVTEKDNEFDPKMQADGGTTYYVMTVDIKG